MLGKLAKQTWHPVTTRCFSAAVGVHEVAKIGFERVGNQYDRGRPSYPKQVTDEYFNEIFGRTFGENDTVIDIGAGTGIFTQILHSYFPETNIMAIDPTSSFRDIMNEKFKENERISVRDGVASDLGFIGSDSISGIFGAQCFHWFAALESLKEFERILDQKGGQRSHLFLIWNAINYEENAFLKELRDDVVHLYHGNEGIGHCKFEPMAHKIERLFSLQYMNDNGLSFKPTTFDFRENAHRQIGDAQMMIDRVLSNSVFGIQSDGERQRIQMKIKEIIIRHYGTLDAELFIPYSTYSIHTFLEPN